MVHPKLYGEGVKSSGAKEKFDQKRSRLNRHFYYGRERGKG